MSNITQVEQNVGRMSIAKEYESLIAKYPLGQLSEAPTSTQSLPDKKLSIEEMVWGDSYLKLGTNEEVLETFGRSLGYLNDDGLSLLRDRSINNQWVVEGRVRKSLNKETLLELVRSSYQSESCMFEQGLRGARNPEDNYWFGEDGELPGINKLLRLTRDAFRELNTFNKQKEGKLNATKNWIDSYYRSWLNISQNNHNYMMENKEIVSKKFSESGLKEDEKNLVFWSALSAFVENLELGGQQK